MMSETGERRRGARGPVDEDKTLGARIRGRRMALGLSQKDLADALGVTFQQIQKYESGANRVSAFAMYRLSTFLGLDLHRIFEGLDPAVEPQAGAAIAAETAAPYASQDDTTAFRRDAEAAVSIMRTMDDNQRRAAIDSLQRIARD